MKKISKFDWNLYKESNRGQDAISKFRKLYEGGCTIDELIEIIQHYDEQYIKNFSTKELDYLRERLAIMGDLLTDIIKDEEITINSIDDIVNLYPLIMLVLSSESEDDTFDSLKTSAFKYTLSDILPLSCMLYIFFPEFYIPNLFVMQFIHLKRLTEKYEIELPKTPKRADYKSRCMYYLNMCIALHNFGVENEFEDKAELCAFLYDYELSRSKEELENNSTRKVPTTPAQAWLLVGNMGEGEKNMQYGFWQANQLTQKGDLLLFYEKSPVKKLNSIWIAQEDGVVDPFFHYYSNTYIGNRINIPDEQAITFNEFKENDYFKVENRGKEGNYVSKNFQDVSGWEVTSDDYKEIRRMLEKKGFDTSVLPKLFIPEALHNIDIHDEHDVEEQLIVPTLKQIGLEYEKDYLRQVVLHLGREDKGRTDFSIFPFGINNKMAKVVIEAKHYINGMDEYNEAYEQAVSYANQQQADLLLIADMKIIHIFERKKKDFVRATPGKLTWKDLYNNEDGTNFIKLKNLIEKYR